MRPGQKKVKTFGEHRPADGRKPPNDFTCLILFQSLGDECNSKKEYKRAKIRAPHYREPSRSRCSGSREDRHSGGVPRRGVNAVGFSEHWFRHRGTTDCPDRSPIRAPAPPVPSSRALKKKGTEIRSTPAGGVTTRCTVAHRSPFDASSSSSPMLTTSVPGIGSTFTQRSYSTCSPLFVVLQQQGQEAAILVRAERCRTERTRSRPSLISSASINSPKPIPPNCRAAWRSAWRSPTRS